MELLVMENESKAALSNTLLSRLSRVWLSPEKQDLNERDRLSPAFFADHFQDLTERDLNKPDLSKLDNKKRNIFEKKNKIFKVAQNDGS